MQQEIEDDEMGEIDISLFESGSQQPSKSSLAERFFRTKRKNGQLKNGQLKNGQLKNGQLKNGFLIQVRVRMFQVFFPFTVIREAVGSHTYFHQIRLRMERHE